MTTQKAFQKLIDDPELIKVAAIPLGTIRQWRKRMKDGKLITLNAMESALKKAGAKKIPENWVFKRT